MRHLAAVTLALAIATLLTVAARTGIALAATAGAAVGYAGRAR